MTAVEVVPGVWLGDLEDAGAWVGPRLCVLETGDHYDMRAGDRHIRILFPGEQDDGPTIARRDCLREAHVVIEEGARRGGSGTQGLLVHCAAGIERSPLTIATWLAETKREPTLKAAYERLMRLRPVVQDRAHWLESEHLAEFVGITVR